MLVGLFLVAGIAQADTQSIDFEGPTYNASSVDGQDGWSATGAAYDQEVVATTTYPSFGSQSLRISDAVASGSFGDWIFAKPLNDGVGESAATEGSFSVGTRQNHFEMQFDIASVLPDVEQPGLHVSVSPDRGDGSRMSFIRFDDTSAGIEVVFSDVQGGSTPSFVLETIGTLDRTSPHNVRLTLDAVDGPSNDVVKVFIDGELVHTGTSWEDYYRFDAEAGAEPTTRIIKTAIFQARGSSNPTNLGMGYLFDNLTLTSTNVAMDRMVPSQYATIQEAVNAANPGDTIKVAAGTYAESISIDKSLTLDGGTGTKPVLSGLAPANYIVKVDGATGVTLNNLEINGGGTVAGANTFSYGVWVHGSGSEGSPVEIKNSAVKNIWNASPTAAIDVDSTSYALINNVDVSGFQKRGIRFTNSSGKVFDGDIAGESVDGTTRVQNLINLWGGSSVEVYNNTLHDAKSAGGTPTWDSPAIFISSYGGNSASSANVHDNEIYNSDTGIVVTSVYADTDTSSATIVDNYFHNLNWGINFEKETGSATVTGNRFENNTKAINAEGDGSPLENPPSVNAAKNWWNTTNQGEISNLVYNEVDFTPWCTSSTCSAFTSGVDVTNTLLTPVEETVTTDAGAVEVDIPAGTTVSGPSDWDGVVAPSQIISDVSTITVTPDNGNTASVSLAIEVGATDVALTLDKAARLLFPGQAGKLVGWSRNGTFSQITGTCSADDQTTMNMELNPGEDCKKDVGSDLVVWTKHFTTFVTYTQTPVPSAPVVSRSSRSGDSSRGIQGVAPAVGQVLGASTMSESARLAEIASLKTQIVSLITQLISLLQGQLAAAIQAQGN